GNFWQKRDLNLSSPAGLLHGQKEPHDHWREEEINQSAANEKKNRRCNQKWQKCHTLISIEARSDKCVNLSGNNRKRQTQTAEHGDLDLRKEKFLRGCINEFGLGPIHPCPVNRPLIWHNQKIEQLLGKSETENERDKKRQNCPNQAAPQFDQVLKQRG